MANRDMAYIWRPSSSHYGRDKEVYAHVMFDSYCFIHPFNIDDRGSDDPFVTDSELETFNADSVLVDVYNRVVQERWYR